MELNGRWSHSADVLPRHLPDLSRAVNHNLTPPLQHQISKTKQKKIMNTEHGSMRSDRNHLQAKCETLCFPLIFQFLHTLKMLLSLQNKIYLWPDLWLYLISLINQQTLKALWACLFLSCTIFLQKAESKNFPTLSLSHCLTLSCLIRYNIRCSIILSELHKKGWEQTIRQTEGAHRLTTETAR